MSEARFPFSRDFLKASSGNTSGSDYSSESFTAILSR